MTVVQLKDVLRTRGLKLSGALTRVHIQLRDARDTRPNVGKKAELIERLETDDA